MRFPTKHRTQLILTGVVTLLIGWQLGIRDEQNRMINRFTLPRDAITGTGKLIIDPEREADMALVWTVWRDLLKSYIAPQELDPEKLIRGAAAGLVRGVGDPYTVYLPPTEAKEFHQSLDGKLEGIGAELQEDGDYVSVVTPIKGSPAEAAGIRMGDVFTEVNGESIAGWTINQVVSKVRGPKGTTVSIKLFREGEPKPITVSIVRDTIRIPSVQGKVVKTSTGSIGVITVAQFGEGTQSEIQEAIRTVRKEPIKGMVVDLRGNGGGYLEAAVGITSLFLKEGKIVTIEKRDEASEERHVEAGMLMEGELPLVILINEGSASASEIMAGALQDNHRALIVGMESFGKGTVQEVHDLPDGSTLKITTARWILPSGKNLAKEGVKPDVEVDLTSAHIEAKKDVQLEAAYAALFHKKWVSGIVRK